MTNEYVKELRAKSTTYLIKKYNHFNSEFRAYARDELKKRKVPQKDLPYKKHKKNTNQLGINFSMPKFEVPGF